MSFRRLLVANRGEIACRVMRTAHRLGYRTIAVCSAADTGALHARQADEAVCIGDAPAAASYLNIDALLDAARRTGAEAVHPGYGFLSERADFARACEAAGLVFIGPPAAAIDAMGDKARAKRRMAEAGVPCVPGYFGEDPGDERLAHEAARLGFPLLVKAVAGGGGRGMRLVRAAAELPAALAGARRESESAFGDGTLMLERLVEGGRHVEVQVFADAHGRTLHLGERDCTAQRRRQKVIEEAPSPCVGPALRQALGRDAVAAAEAVGYRGAGTVEFIVDGEGRHFFLEMNTRLQVEHPVTECLTGLDLVEWQLRVAAGEPLPWTQDEIRFEGHAIEARLIVEDPYDGFRPQTGRVTGWRPRADEAAAPAGVRIDHGLAEGDEVTPFYDAMVAKFIVHGRNRAEAIRRLTRALEETPLFGPRHNGRFLRDLVNHPRFTGATMTTAWLDACAAEPEASREPLLVRPRLPEWAWRAAAAWLGGVAGTSGGAAPARPAGVAGFELTLACDGEVRRLTVPVAGVRVRSFEDRALRVEVDGVARRAHALPPATADGGMALQLAIDGAVFTVTEASPLPSAPHAADPGRALAPVAGVVAQVAVAAGDRVVAGQALVSVESMKMEMWLQAAAAGTVRAVHAERGRTVAAGDLLVELEPEAERPEAPS